MGNCGFSKGYGLTYYIQIKGAPPHEKKLLQDRLTIGSDCEGLSLQHPHLSPEHCTLLLQENVLSIIDHHSDLGVTINGQRVAADKMIILLPSDEVKLGHLTILFFPADDQQGLEDKTLVLSPQETATALDLGPKELDLDLALEESPAMQPPTTRIATEIIEPTFSHIPQKSIELDSQQIDEQWSLDLAVDSPKSAHTSVPIPAQPTLQQLEEQDSGAAEEWSDLGLEDKLTDKVEKTEPMLLKTSTSSTSTVSKVSVEPEQTKKIAPKMPAKKVLHQKNKFSRASGSRHYYYRQLSAAGAPVRIVALMIDLILGMKLTYLLWEMNWSSPIELTSEFVNFAVDSLLSMHPALEAYIGLASAHSDYLAGFLLLRLLGVLVFGVSIGQLLLLCYHEGSFFLKRTLGLVRELLGFALGPLLIFDIGALFGKKTVKEFLTMSGLQCRASTLSPILGSLLLVPLFIWCFYWTPFYEHYWERPSVRLTTDRQVEVLKYTVGANDRHQLTQAYLNYFALYAPQTNLKEGLVMVPFLGQQKKNVESKLTVGVRPKLFFMDPVKGLFARVERGDAFGWRNSLLNVVDQSPQLKKIYPMLWDFAQGRKVAPAEFQLQLRDFLFTSFTLNWDTQLWWTGLRFGPSVLPFLEVRSWSRSWGIEQGVWTATIVQVAKRDYLLFYQAQDELKTYWKKVYIIPIASQRAYIYQVSFPRQSFDLSLRWFKDQVFSRVKHLPKILPQVTLASSLELLMQRKGSLEQMEKNAPALFHLYFEAATSLVQVDQHHLQLEFLQHLKQTIELLNQDNQQIKQTVPKDLANLPLVELGYDKLIKKLGELYVQLEQRQQSYFASESEAWK